MYASPQPVFVTDQCRFKSEKSDNSDQPKTILSDVTIWQ